MKKIILSLLLSALSGMAFSQVSTVSSIAGSSAICLGTSQTYTAIANNSPTSYHWSSVPSAGVAFSSISSAVVTITFNPSLPDNYPVNINCYAINSSGQGPQYVYTVTALAQPYFSSTAKLICNGSSANMVTQPYESSGIGVTYNWTPAAGLNTTTGSSVIASPSVTTIYTITAANGPCNFSDTVTVFVNPCTGIKSNNLSDNETLIYPNPSNGDFVIKTEGKEQINIINELGQIIETISALPGVETKISSLPLGVYCISSATSRKKVIVTKE